MQQEKTNALSGNRHKRKKKQKIAKGARKGLQDPLVRGTEAKVDAVRGRKAILEKKYSPGRYES